MKHYDRAYFDRWYRAEGAPKGPPELARQVALAVAATESVLDRELASVLDVGCGEGRWQPVIQEIRPGANYLGLDPSDYAVERFGESRNLLSGSFQELEAFAFEEPFDLLVCADVLHYLDDTTILSGIDTLADLVGGVALLEVFTAEDPALGDREGFHLRAPAWYQRVFRSAGLVPVGLQMWVHEEIAETLDAMDLPMAFSP